MSPLSGRREFYLYCRQQGRWLQEVAGHSPSDPGWFAPFEPARHVSPAYPPTLLLHGEAGTDVPFEESARMADAPAAHGVEHEFIRDPDWGHSFDFDRPTDPKVREAVAHAVSFLVRHV